MTVEPGKLVEGRGCNGCTMCCKLLGIKEFNKPQMVWCQHCDVGVGCKIYDSRPAECSGFYCDYLMQPELDERWYPKQSKMVVVYRGNDRAMAIYVDTSRKDAWKKAPFYAQIKAWANNLCPQRGQVVVWEGNNAVAILPNRDKALGAGEPVQLVAVFEKMTPQGMIYDAVLMDKGAPIESVMHKVGKT